MRFGVCHIIINVFLQTSRSFRPRRVRVCSASFSKWRCSSWLAWSSSCDGSRLAFDLASASSSVQLVFSECVQDTLELIARLDATKLPPSLPDTFQIVSAIQDSGSLPVRQEAVELLMELL